GELAAGVPLVVLEPSCGSVFRHELKQLFPGDSRAERLAAQTVLLPELLAEPKPPWAGAALTGAALLQTHCHEKSIWGESTGRPVLARLGLEVSEPEEGCCGMAGAFGFEREHRDVSVAIGELALLPAVRRARADTLLVADGFSCREQIRQETGREALHTAQVLLRALRTSARAPFQGMELARS